MDIKSKEAYKRVKKIKQLHKEKAVFLRLGEKLRAYFFTGVLVTAPVAITFYVAYNIFIWIDGSVNQLIPPEFFSRYNIPFKTIPGLGIVILIVGLILVGMFAAGFIGKIFVRLGDWIVRKLPVISSIYSLLKQIFETFLSSNKQSFSKCVLLEYPRKGLWVIGFVSAETKGEVKQRLDDELLSVYVSTTPNPTSGFLIFVPKKDTIPLDMSVEEGHKYIISCGIVEPEQLKNK